MIFQPPTLQPDDHAVLDLIADQRTRLRHLTQSSPSRWAGTLRRNAFARAIRASNSIEGIHASLENVVAAIENDDPTDIQKDTWLDIRGYRDAMTYIIQAAQDPYFEFSKQFLKSVQFMIVGHDMTKHPGQWRPGQIYVVDQSSRSVVYEAPPVEDVDGLIQELVSYLKAKTNEPAIVKAAMAHLNLTMIHPFKDGNGRTSRALQSLMIAQEGLLHPCFCSIEEWLGANTRDYYDVLAQIGQGHWRPQADALPWVRLCLRAHFQQAATLIRRNSEYANLFERIAHLVATHHLPDRSTMPLLDAALGLSITNSWYRRDAEVSEFVASRDLKRLSEVGLLEPLGEKRGRSYQASAELKRHREETRINAPMGDPYDMIEQIRIARITPNNQPSFL
jgi:Fic family protein